MRYEGLVSRRRLSAGLALTGVAMALSACGGGGGGAGGFGTGPNGGGTPQSDYTAEERSAATGRIAEKFEQLAATGGATEATWAALRDWVLTQPEYTAAGVGDKLLWARFTDGRYFLYTDNWRAMPAQPAAGVPAPEKAFARAKALQAPALAAADLEVPGSANALLLRFEGPEFNEGNGAMTRMPKALKEHGWNVAPDQALTIAALKNRGELGLLFVTSHSGMFGPDDEKEFSLMLNDEATVSNEIDHAADLFTGRLIYHRDRNTWQRLGYAKSPRYAATSRFVTEYLSFSSNSLVILLSCNSGAEKAKVFRDAFAAKGASSIIAWDGNANYYSFYTPDKLIDRLTGANLADPSQKPPNRAFNMKDVWAWLEEQLWTITPPWDPTFETAFAKLFGGGFDLSNPVITELQAAAHDKLFIHGDFGSAPGSLTIGGTPVAFEKWGSKLIEVNLPTGPNDPPGSAGHVVVKARERTSNLRTLTSWRGQISYVLEDRPDGDGAGVLVNKITVDLHLRGDPFARRTEVDGVLRPNTWNVIPASDTRVTYEASGVHNYGDGDVETWEGRGAYEYSMEARFNAETEAKLAIVARIDAINKRFEIAPVFSNLAPAIVRTRTDGVSPRLPSGRMRMPPFGMQFMNENGNLNDHGPLVYGTYLPFGANGSISGGQHAAADGDLRRVIQWNTMTALPTLDDDIGR